MNVWMMIGGAVGACCTGAVNSIYEYSQQKSDREPQEQQDTNHQEIVTHVNEQRHHPTLEEIIEHQLQQRDSDIDTEIDIKIEIHSHTKDSK